MDAAVAAFAWRAPIIVPSAQRPRTRLVGLPVPQPALARRPCLEPRLRPGSRLLRQDRPTARDSGLARRHSPPARSEPRRSRGGDAGRLPNTTRGLAPDGRRHALVAVCRNSSPHENAARPPVLPGLPGAGYAAFPEGMAPGLLGRLLEAREAACGRLRSMRRAGRAASILHGHAHRLPRLRRRHHKGQPSDDLGTRAPAGPRVAGCLAPSLARRRNGQLRALARPRGLRCGQVPPRGLRAFTGEHATAPFPRPW